MDPGVIELGDDRGDANHFPPDRLEYLRSKERKKKTDPIGFLKKVEEYTGSLAGRRVADLGCGPGFFTEAMAGFVRKVNGACEGVQGGVVFAIDVEKRALDMIDGETDGAMRGTVVRVLSTEKSIPLPDGTVDVVFMINVFHEIVVTETLQEAVRILRNGGYAVVRDWHPEAEETPGPPPEKRISPAGVENTMERMGFKTIAHLPDKASHYTMVLQKRA